MKKKINILAISNGNTSGVAYFRIIQPITCIRDNYQDDFNILVLASDEVNLEAENLKNIDVVHFHANCSNDVPLMNRLFDMQKNGCKLIMDLDDFFEIPSSNPYAVTYNNKLSQPIKLNLLKVDALTTTTKLFKAELKKWTKKKCYVFPNLITAPVKQSPEESKIRIGIICGASHEADIELLRGMISQLGDYNDKIIWSVNGFDIRQNKHPELSIWNRFEQIFTDDYKLIGADYKDYLLTYNKQEYPLIDSQAYRRYWAEDILQYTKLYDNIDILLAPLENTKFNQMKSELKITEAGTFGKVFIGSAVGIYKEIITPGYDGLLVPAWDNETGWSKAVRKIIDNKLLYNSLKANLNQTIRNKYDIEKWSKKRIDLYKSLT